MTPFSVIKLKSCQRLTPDLHVFGVLVVIGLLPHLYGLARQACFTIGKEPSVNKANDPPEQKVKGSGSGVFKASLGLPR